MLNRTRVPLPNLVLNLTIYEAISAPRLWRSTPTTLELQPPAPLYVA